MRIWNLPSSVFCRLANPSRHRPCPPPLPPPTQILSELSPLSRFAVRFHRACSWTWREFFFRHEYNDSAVNEMCNPINNELRQEWLWASHRQGSLVAGEQDDHPIPEIDRIDMDDPMIFRKALNVTENKFREAYAAQSPGECWQLNQNPCNGHGTRTTGPCLMTLIRNSHLLYTESVMPERWLLGSEAVIAQAFPLHPGQPVTRPLPGFLYVAHVMSCRVMSVPPVPRPMAHGPMGPWPMVHVMSPMSYALCGGYAGYVGSCRFMFLLQNFVCHVPQVLLPLPQPS